MTRTKCHYCNKTFDTDDKLVEHLASTHSPGELSRIDRRRVEQYTKQHSLTNRIKSASEQFSVSRRQALTALGAGTAGIAGLGGQVLGSMSDFAGGSGTALDPYQIANWTHLDNVRNNLDKHFVLTADLDRGTAGYEDVANSGSLPIGPSSFTGTFDGQGNAIRDFNIDINANYVGLFRAISGKIKNLTIASANITNDDSEFGTGALAGQLAGTAQSIAVINSNVDGGTAVGGLAGYLKGGIIQGTSVSGSGNIKGDYNNGEGPFGAFGGIVGYALNGGTIKKCETGVTVRGAKGTGGILGNAGGGSITIVNSTATGTIEGTELNYKGGIWPNGQTIGGLVGAGVGANLTIAKSSATGTIRGTEKVGGLVGEGPPDLTIERSYSTADITATESGGSGSLMDEIGGLVGSGGNIKIDNSYAAGSITVNNAATPEPEHIGGVFGGYEDADDVDKLSATASNTYWDTERTGVSDGVGDSYGTNNLTTTGLTTSEMQGTAAEANMNLDFGTTWRSVSTDGPSGRVDTTDGYPVLQTPVTGIELAGSNEATVVVDNSTVTVDTDEES